MLCIQHNVNMYVNGTITDAHLRFMWNSSYILECRWCCPPGKPTPSTSTTGPITRGNAHIMAGFPREGIFFPPPTEGPGRGAGSGLPDADTSRLRPRRGAGRGAAGSGTQGAYRRDVHAHTDQAVWDWGTGDGRELRPPPAARGGPQGRPRGGGRP